MSGTCSLGLSCGSRRASAALILGVASSTASMFIPSAWATLSARSECAMTGRNWADYDPELVVGGPDTGFHSLPSHHHLPSAEIVGARTIGGLRESAKKTTSATSAPTIATM